MYPVLFKLTVFGGHIEIGSYRFFLILAATVGVGLAWLIAGRRGLPSRQTLILLLAVAAAVPIGARLLHVATNYGVYARDPGRLFALRATGFALYGGLLLAVVVGPLLCRLLKLDVWRLADSAAPAMGLSMAVVRVGCFLDGCCAGVPSSLPWAVSFPNSGAADLVKQTGSLPILGGALREIATKPAATHPVDIYELIASLAGVALVIFLLRRRAADGVAFIAFALWFSAFRLVNHPLRVPTADFTGPAWFYPALYIAAGAVSLAALITIIRRPAAVRQRGTSQPIAELSVALPEQARS